jgi:uncharacterized membrane protein YkvI
VRLSPSRRVALCLAGRRVAMGNVMAELLCVLMCLKLFYTQVVMLACGSGTETMWWDG